MKTAIISYHKNINQVYERSWIEGYKRSILWQSKKNIPVFELNYGGSLERIFEDSYFESVDMPTFVHAMNYLIDKVFSGGYDCVFNSNADDLYHSEWVESTLDYIEAGYDLVSCNFHLFDNMGITHTHQFSELNIEKELGRNHNIICHPGVCYSKEFWSKNRYVPEEIPFEDRELWKRAIKNSKFIIQSEHLCYHRVHDNSVTKSKNR
jgi:hypothetical protein